VPVHHQNNGNNHVTDSTDHEDEETGCQFTPVIQEKGFSLEAKNCVPTHIHFVQTCAAEYVCGVLYVLLDLAARAATFPYLKDFTQVIEMMRRHLSRCHGY